MKSVWPCGDGGGGGEYGAAARGGDGGGRKAERNAGLVLHSCTSQRALHVRPRARALAKRLRRLCDADNSRGAARGGGKLTPRAAGGRAGPRALLPDARARHRAAKLALKARVLTDVPRAPNHNCDIRRHRNHRFGEEGSRNVRFWRDGVCVMADVVFFGGHDSTSMFVAATRDGHFITVSCWTTGRWHATW